MSERWSTHKDSLDLLEFLLLAGCNGEHILHIILLNHLNVCRLFLRAPYSLVFVLPAIQARIIVCRRYLLTCVILLLGLCLCLFFVVAFGERESTGCRGCGGSITLLWCYGQAKPIRPLARTAYSQPKD